MKISLIIPSRNNLKYLSWMYSAVNRNKGDVEVELCIADDASTDGTWEWGCSIAEQDPNFKIIQNKGPERLGHTVLYDKLIKEVATGEVVGIYHADMYLCPGALEEVRALIAPKTVISLTRIEPPLHPAGPEKVIADFAIEPEYFNEEVFLKWFERFQASQQRPETDGIFAPWFIFKQDFLYSNGHDRLYAPQSKEDSDIFNRFSILKYTFKQTWKGFVYHMTSRGSRFNPTLTTPGVNSKEWELQNKISERNFIRKWGNVPLHTATLKPIVPPHYKTAIILRNATLPAVRALEPWTSTLVIDNWDEIVPQYLKEEQPRTLFNLSKRLHHVDFFDSESAPVLLEVDTLNLNGQTFLDIQNLLFHLKSIWETKREREAGNEPTQESYEAGSIKITLRALEEKDCNYVFN